MHVSLDSALGRQRRLNSVGESVLQIAPNAAAAYSLRSLTGGDPKVVRVRRASDNHEQDFTASGVSSGALTSFVNAQVVAPLDIQALSATGRDGDFLIAKAAYSLRSLGTRQATLAATGDTVARADGKFVAQVRRSSDDAVKSFTADEVTDGTLLAFTNADYAKYTSDFSSGDDSWGSFDDVTETGNIDGIGGLDNNLRLAIGSATSGHRAFRSSTLPVGQKINFSARVFVPSTNSDVDGILIRDANGTVIVATTAPTQDEWVTVTANDVTPINAQLRVNLQKGAASSFTGNGSDEVYLREITVTQVTSDGFVKTWYDQSVTNQAGDTATGNHAVQATAAEQPKIVNAGALLADGIEFDGSDDTLNASSVSGFGSTISMFEASVRDGGGAAVVSMGSSASTSNTNFGLVEAGSNTQASVRNTTSRTVNASVSGSTRLGFAVTTGQTSTKVGALGGTLVETTDDYGDDFTSGELDTIFLGKLRSGSGTTFNGHIREALVYGSDQTDNRTAIEANIGEAYNIDLPAGVDPGFDQVDGFVETWYDQSGNSKDAIQTTANLQPAIVVAGVFQNGLKFDSDGSSSGPDFRTPISSAQLSNDPAGHNGFALVWVGNVNEVQHADTQNHSVLGNIKGVATFSTGTIGLTVIPTTGTTKFINETGGSTTEIVQDTNALTPGDFGVVFFSFENAEAGLDPLLSVDGSTTISALSSLNSSSSNNIGIMTAITGGNSVQYSRSADGICKEVLLYTGDQKSKRVALETNIAAEYGITLS